MESSDRDGGSSVAVMYYLRQMLHTLDYPDLVHMMLEYLLALPENSDSRRSIPSSPVLQRRQSSLILLMQHKSTEGKMNPSLFSLTDLILNSMRSSSPQTVIAALKLVSVLLEKNHDYALNTLIKSQAVQSDISRRTMGSLDAETKTYLLLAEKIGVDPNLDETYENHLKDVTELLEAHRCTVNSQDGTLAVDHVMNSKASLRSRVRLIEPHRLSTYDPTLLCLCTLLESFFTNDIETNLSLTECFIILASCPYLRLERWMVVDPARYSRLGDCHRSSSMADLSSTNKAAGTDSPDSDLERLRRSRSNLARPSWASDENPRLLMLLQSLVSQLEKLREAVPSFPDLLSTRKATFRTHDALIRAESGSLTSTGISKSFQSTSPKFPVQKPQTPSRTSGPSTPSTPASNAEGLSSLPRRLFTETLNLSASRKNSPSIRQTATSASPANDQILDEALNARSSTPLRKQYENSGSHTPSATSSTRLPPSNVHLASASSNEEVRSGTLQSKTHDSKFLSNERESSPASIDRSVDAGNDVHVGLKTFVLLTKRVRFFQDGHVEFETNQPDNEVTRSSQTSVFAQDKNDDNISESGQNDKNIDGVKLAHRDGSIANSRGDLENDDYGVKDSRSSGSSLSTDSDPDADTTPKFKAVSLNHVLTNTVVLQEFILELVAVLQVRASLFAEVQFG